MLACDLLLQARASRSVNSDQVAALERMVFGHGRPSRDHLDLLLTIDTYLQRSDPTWASLLHRAAIAAMVAGPEPASSVTVGTA